MTFRPLACGHLAAAILVTAVAGCTRYLASPLATSADALSLVDPAALITASSIIDRPFLAPGAIDFSVPLTLDALAVIAVVESPELRALRARTGVAEAQAFAARLLPDPTAAASFAPVLSGPDTFNAFAGQLGFDLAQLRLRRVTRAASDATRRQVRLDLAWAEWQTAGQARLLGVRVVGLSTASSLVQASAAAATKALDTALRAAGRGDIAGAELDARRQVAIDAADRARATESGLVAARGDLNKVLGLPPATTLRLAAPPAAAPLPPAAALVTLALGRRLDLAALQAGYAAAEANTRRAVLEQFPALLLTFAGGRDTANNYTIGPQVGFTLPLWNRNRGGIAVATATRAQLKAEYAARLFTTRADIVDLVAALDTLTRQRAALAAALPPLRRYAEATVRAASRGDLPQATAAAATQIVRDRELALVSADQTIAEQTIALELLTGTLREGWTR